MIDTSATWLYAAAAIAEVLGTAAVFLYVATRLTDGTRARLFAMIGFELILMQVLGGLLSHFMLVRSAGPAALGQGVLLFSSLGNVLSVISKFFLAAAVFTGREASNSTDPMVPMRPGSFDDNHSNPYRLPRR